MVKNIFIMTFSVTKCFQIKSQFKKIYIIKKKKKLKRTHVCFTFHHDTQRFSKFCLCNQSTEKGSHFTLL